MNTEEVVYLDEEKWKTPEGKVLDRLNLTKMCCRRHMLTHVDIIINKYLVKILNIFKSL